MLRRRVRSLRSRESLEQPQLEPAPLLRRHGPHQSSQQHVDRIVAIILPKLATASICDFVTNRGRLHYVHGPSVVTMELRVVEEAGVKIVEGAPNEPCMSSIEDATGVIEMCFSRGAQRVLLYADNLTDKFFDLSSGEAGAILQKFRNYGIRLAVVSSPTRVWSSRFGEMVAEERRGRSFALLDSRADACEWLSRD